MKDIYFIDFEASSLDWNHSFPTELGWAFSGGGADSALIRPVKEWTGGDVDDFETPWLGWNPIGHKITGISQEMLVENGMDVKNVIERFEAATNGYELYADNPNWDGRWMQRLYTAAGHEHAPEVKDYTRLIAPYASGAVGQTMLMLAQAKADETAPRTHRAQDDAVHLATVYQLLLDAQ